MMNHADWHRIVPSVHIEDGWNGRFARACEILGFIAAAILGYFLLRVE